MNAYLLLLSGSVVQLFTIALFAIVAGSDVSAWQKYLPLVVGAIVTLVVVSLYEKAGNRMSRIAFSGWLALSGALHAEILARTLFPGLSKDVELFSVANVIQRTILALMLFAGYWTAAKLLQLLATSKTRPAV